MTAAEYAAKLTEPQMRGLRDIANARWSDILKLGDYSGILWRWTVEGRFLTDLGREVVAVREAA